jgi:hypothetical protein
MIPRALAVSVSVVQKVSQTQKVRVALQQDGYLGEAHLVKVPKTDEGENAVLGWMYFAAERAQEMDPLQKLSQGLNTRTIERAAHSRRLGRSVLSPLRFCSMVSGSRVPCWPTEIHVSTRLLRQLSEYTLSPTNVLRSRGSALAGRPWRLPAKGAGSTIWTLLCGACGAPRTVCRLRVVVVECVVPAEAVEKGRGAKRGFGRLKE